MVSLVQDSATSLEAEKVEVLRMVVAARAVVAAAKAAPAVVVEVVWARVFAVESAAWQSAACRQKYLQLAACCPRIGEYG